MVLYTFRYNIHPDKTEEYSKWVPSAVERVLGTLGIKEFRAYRHATGSNQILTICEFANMDDWEKWFSHEDIYNVIHELYALTLNLTSELWGPSPVVPKPLRPA